MKVRYYFAAITCSDFRLRMKYVVATDTRTCQASSLRHSTTTCHGVYILAMDCIAVRQVTLRQCLSTKPWKRVGVVEAKLHGTYEACMCLELRSI
jgi:hypothetical protein